MMFLTDSVSLFALSPSMTTKDDMNFIKVQFVCCFFLVRSVSFVDFIQVLRLFLLNEEKKLNFINKINIFRFGMETNIGEQKFNGKTTKVKRKEQNREKKQQTNTQ